MELKRCGIKLSTHMHSDSVSITHSSVVLVSSSQNPCHVIYRKNRTYLMGRVLFVCLFFPTYYFSLCNPVPYYKPFKSGFEDEVIIFRFGISVGLNHCSISALQTLIDFHNTPLRWGIIINQGNGAQGYRGQKYCSV